MLAALCLLSGLLLPLAPVLRDRPVVTWPQDPSAVESTSLMLTAYRPAALDVSVGCSAVAAADAGEAGVVLATMDPLSPLAPEQGLLWTAAGGQQRLVVAGQVLLEGPVDPGPCTYRLQGDGEGLALTRDGLVLAEPAGTTHEPVDPDLPPPPPGGPAALSSSLPAVDLLTSSLGAVEDDAALSVRLLVDDRGASSPAPAKLALVGVLLATGALLVVLAAVEDRRRRAAPRLPGAPAAGDRAGPRRRRPRAVDAVVVLVALAWVPIAPMTDDDGYYAAMSAAVDGAGYVSQYFQLWGQDFVPLTWPWYALGAWVDLGGRSAVWLRLPALALGLATWAALRAVLHRTALGRGRTAPRLRWALALAFLAAWLPYDMGVRPEGVGAAASAVVLLLVLVSAQTGRLLPLTGAVLVGALALAGHPTGAVALAPALAGLPTLLPVVVREGAGVLDAARRLALVVAPGAVVVTAGFADGTVEDFLSARALFADVEEPLGWMDEVRRYGLLLDDIPMGAYAKRTAVLVGLLAVLWGVLALVASRRPGARPPALVRLATWTALLAYVSLWVTPSKWTHHFGALAGTVPLLVALLLVLGPALWRRCSAGRPAPAPALALVLVTAAVAALALSGPNAWPYAPDIGILGAGRPPAVAGAALGSLPLWLVVAAAALLAVRLLARRRGRAAPSAAPAATASATVVVLLLAVSSTYLLGTFARQAQVALVSGSWAPGGAALSDPAARRCDAGSALRVVDDRSAAPLAPAGGGDAVLDGFAAGSGWWPGSPPPQPLGQGLLGTAWGSLSPDEGVTGALTSGWYVLPDAGQEVVVASAGDQELPGAVLLETGAAGPDGVEVLSEQDLSDGESSAEWRVGVLADRPPGAELVRVRAADEAAGPGGWVAVGAPAAARTTTVAELAGDAPVAASWQLTWRFPCLDQVSVASGITERPALGLLWGGPAYEGLADNTWQAFRGGLFGQLERSAVLLRLPSEVEGRPAALPVAVVRLSWPTAEGAYDLRLDQERTSGLSGPTTDDWTGAGDR